MVWLREVLVLVLQIAVFRTLVMAESSVARPPMDPGSAGPALTVTVATERSVKTSMRSARLDQNNLWYLLRQVYSLLLLRRTHVFIFGWYVVQDSLYYREN